MVDPRLEKLIPKFIENQKTEFERIKAAIKIFDYEELKMIGHRMKGGCGGYGFHELGNLGGQIEYAAEKQDPLSVHQVLQRIEAHLNFMKIQYKQNKGQ